MFVHCICVHSVRTVLNLHHCVLCDKYMYTEYYSKLLAIHVVYTLHVTEHLVITVRSHVTLL